MGRQDRSGLRRTAAALAGVLSLAGCGGAAMIATARSTKFATTPTSRGPIDLRAVPLGDGYVSTSPKVGYVDSCVTHFGIGGSQVDGPWIDTKTKTWDLTRKLAVEGNVHWSGSYLSVRTSGSKRIVRLDDLPTDHTTGVFPIATSDPAYQYDHNGNHIAKHALSWRLPRNPRAAKKPGCTPGGPIGVLSDGVLLFNALDGGGRDAAAHEILDRCAGHPAPGNVYHHHDIPPCILNKARRGRATLVGYALDGYGIYVVKSRNGTLPTNTALDACHGTVSRVLWNGRMQRVYHYVATLEYPYTVGCFHGTAISSGLQGAGTGGPPAGAPPAGAAAPGPGGPPA